MQGERAQPTDPPELFTIGHSNHPAAAFVALLARHAVEGVADVRSTPHSRRHPHFARRALETELRAHGIGYEFFGDGLGARPRDPSLYRDGRVDFDRLAASEAFQLGLARLLAAARRQRIAVMCAEREPLDCHRLVLVARHLSARGARVLHILADASLETQAEVEARLLRAAGRDRLPLLAALEDRSAELERAYAERGRAIAYPQRA